MEKVRLTREMFINWQVPDDIYTFSTNGAGENCSGTYTQTEIKLLLLADKTDVSPDHGGLSVTSDFQFQAEMTAEIGLEVEVEITAEWQIGIVSAPIVKSYSFVQFEVYSLFNSAELELQLTPYNITFVVE